MRAYRGRNHLQKGAQDAAIERRAIALRVGHQTGAAQPVTREIPSRTAVSYTGADIRLLTPEEAADRFPFEKTRRLAERYPQSAHEFIERLVMACMSVGFDVDLAARRYLGNDRSIPVPSELIEAHREQIRLAREKLNRRAAA
jgi:hypothetical protein